MSNRPVERVSWEEHEHVARCDNECGWEGRSRDDAIKHSTQTGHVTYYRRIVEETFKSRLEDR